MKVTVKPLGDGRWMATYEVPTLHVVTDSRDKALFALGLSLGSRPWLEGTLREVAEGAEITEGSVE